MSLNIVRMPAEYFGDPNQNRPIFFGSIFIGEPDTDPEIEVNRKTVIIRQEDGTEVPIAPEAQPLLTGGGGYVLYDGSPVSVLVDGNYSIKVLDKSGGQSFYFDNILDGAPVTASDTNINFTTVAEMAADTTLQVGNFVSIESYTATNNSGVMFGKIVAAGTGVDDGGSYIDLAGSGLQFKQNLPANINSRIFGTEGDGVQDDGGMIQAALNTKRPVLLDAGNYRITSELVLNDSQKLSGVGASRWIYDVPSQIWDPAIHSYITYDGALDPAACAVRVSAYAVGVEPTGTQVSASNTGLSSIGIDCNQKCGIGVYFVRPDGAYKNVHVKGSLKHAYVFLNIGGVTFEDLNAYRNEENGFTIGDDLYGWTALFADESVFIRPLALFNGESGPFRENLTNTDGYGIGVFNSRGLTFIGYESSWNDGPGIWHENRGAGGVLFVGGYSEFNCSAAVTAGRCTQDYGLWYEGTALTNNARNMKIDHAQVRDAIRLSGVEPSREFSGGPVFEGLGYVPEVKSDWDNYRLINCNAGMIISSVGPTPSLGTFGLNEQFGVIAAGSFSGVTGAITNDSHAGIIDRVDYVSPGRYSIVFKAGISIPVLNYSVLLTTGSNRFVGVSSKDTYRVLVDNYSTSGIVDSNATIEYQIIKFK